MGLIITFCIGLGIALLITVYEPSKVFLINLME